MHGAHLILKRIALIIGSVTLLAACSSMTQPAAPVVQYGGRAATTSAPAPTPDTGAGSSDVYAVKPAERIAPIGSSRTSTISAPAANPADAPESYTVKPGDNLFRIALNNGLGYRELAELNGIGNPADIKVGQVLKLRASEQGASPAPHTPAATAAAEVPAETASASSAPINSGNGESRQYPKAIKLPYGDNAATRLAQLSEGQNGNGAAAVASAPARTAPEEHKAAADKPAAATTPTPAAAAGDEQVAGGWLWPTDGKIAGRYNATSKGLDITGKSGQTIVAAADGKVVYSGSGLRGYGKLVIIKHNKTFLSAYAHNSALSVKEGQAVKKGQKIAEMGNTDADQVKLHFEIRRYGKPVDPENYLAKR